MSTQLSLMRDTPQRLAADTRLELMARKLHRLFERWKSQGKPSR